MIRGVNRRSFIAAAALAAGCAQTPAPPLARLYRDIGPREGQPPVIVIPGAFGSRLRRKTDGEEIWPRSNASLLFSSYPDIRLDIDESTLQPITEDVEAPDIFREGLGQDFYGKVIDTLQNIGGYQRLYPGQRPDPTLRSFYVFPYDWRLDNVAVVKELDRFIEQIAADHQDPSIRFDFLAHSNGGMLVRYYARYGTDDLLDPSAQPSGRHGSHRVRRLVLVGTPNLGTMQPVLSHVRGEEVGLRKIPAEVVATCSGAPQLMPHPDIPWLYDINGRRMDLDVFDMATWRELNWSIFRTRTRLRTIRRHGGGNAGRRYLGVLEDYMAHHMARGRRFHELMGEPARDYEPLPYVFGADCTPTVAALVVEKQDSYYQGHESPETIRRPIQGVDYSSILREPGDGVVTRASLMGRRHSGNASPRLQIAHSVFLCEAHQQLTGNPSFQDNLLYTLLSAETD
jgi:hypothetical protein